MRDKEKKERDSNFEVYNVSASPEDSKILINGLDFSDNSYKTGTLDFSSKESSLILNKELTGIIKTVIQLPQ